MNYNPLVLLIIAIIPVVFLLSYIYKHDPHKETFGSLIKMFLLGVLSIIPTVIVELLISAFVDEKNLNIISLFIYVFIGVAIVEEFFKWIMIKKFVYNTEKFDEYYDAIVYCTYSSLGFACLENILYVVSSGLGTGILRAFTAVPGHTCFGIIMGYYLCYAKFNHIRNNTKEYKKYLSLSILVPAIAHTLYDYFLMAGLLIPALAFYIFLVIYCVKLVKKVSTQNQPFFVSSPSAQTESIPPIPNSQTNFCPNCGNPTNGGNYCSKCGHKI